MQLSGNNRHSFLLAIHQSIEEEAAGSAKELLQGQVNEPAYPPNGGFTTEEEGALKLLQNNEVLQSAVRKVLADCAAGVVFNLLNLIDGTSDPEHGDWTGVMLVDKPRNNEEYRELLHDDFFEAYWNWRETRPDKTWCLDTFSE
ncbi:hypothetical protein Q5H92_02965 [Hymenobacter sp. M29]|uniref:Uncharacterized protein n=1 Tax=Hymenobacter mellowenesis TaxID=3063995 RepID=A0ABT9A647_9BACT|nr:hypothetical protein [Hymenobacter sp. M29]MDO7845303.1 hypothetical protein [Hymenobacter sp. M29]